MRRRQQPDDESPPVRLTFGARVNESEEWADRVGAILDEIQQRNIWANRQAAYDPEWDWRNQNTIE